MERKISFVEKWSHVRYVHHTESVGHGLVVVVKFTAWVTSGSSLVEFTISISHFGLIIVQQKCGARNFIPLNAGILYYPEHSLSIGEHTVVVGVSGKSAYQESWLPKYLHLTIDSIGEKNK